MSRYAPVLYAIVSLTIAAAQQAGAPPVSTISEPEHVDVFVSGAEGVAFFRIPALVTTSKGTLVAVADARISRINDAPNNIDLGMKRSFDSGKTWTPLRIIRDYPGEQAAADPCLLVDRQTGTLWLFYDYAIPKPGAPGGRIITLHVMHSDDDGETWSDSVDLSPTLKDPDWMTLNASPGTGIQTRSGRLIAPAYSTSGDGKTHPTHLIYSDDHGATWQITEGIGSDENECQVVELFDGTLLLNARRAHPNGCRGVARSNDGGRTWTAMTDDPTLIESGCQASMIRYTNRFDGQDKNRLLFSNPATQSGRHTGTVRLSYDEGDTWPVSRIIYPGSFAYSSLTVLPDGSIGVLYERDAHKKISFARFTLDWLTEGRDHYSMTPPQPKRGYSIPTVDLAAETDRQITVDREPGQYLGHPTTVLLENGRTMICVYPKGHGRGAIVMKRSEDGGLTWSERLPVPESWATSLEVPTIYRTIDRQGVKRLIMFSGLYPIRMAVSEDDGATWSELEKIGDFGGIVAMSDLVRLQDGRTMALFHDDGRFLHGEGKTTSFTMYKCLSEDGGLTWSEPIAIASHPQAHLCEGGIVRSPNGNQLAVLLRENSRKLNSFVIFSNDEGETWSDPIELPGSLTGDRHQAIYAPDGRLVISFRDTTHETPTKGDWVAWVGTYEDIVNGAEGQCRVRLMDNHKGADCAYPALELLPDGTIVATTYGHWIPDEQPYIASVRFTLDEIDAKARQLEADK